MYSTPHMRGAYLNDNGIVTALDGSSPRTWGLLRGLRTDDLPVRFIPTHVGFTLLAHEVGAGKTGSSPRVWGLRTMKARCR